MTRPLVFVCLLIALVQCANGDDFKKTNSEWFFLFLLRFIHVWNWIFLNFSELSVVKQIIHTLEMTNYRLSMSFTLSVGDWVNKPEINSIEGVHKVLIQSQPTTERNRFRRTFSSRRAISLPHAVGLPAGKGRHLLSLDHHQRLPLRCGQRVFILDKRKPAWSRTDESNWNQSNLCRH